MCIRDSLIVFTRGGVPIYLRDVAEVRDTTEDLRSFTRINGKPGIRLRVTKQSGKNTCLLYTSDAADERSSVDLGGRRLIKKKNEKKKNTVWLCCPTELNTLIVTTFIYVKQMINHTSER